VLAGCSATRIRSRTIHTSSPLRAKNGLVVSAHIDASEAGGEVMKQGGNAIDAAVATGFALAVVYPVAGNIGGGGFMVIRFAGGDATSFDYRERAPMASSGNMYLDQDGNPVVALSRRGHLASGVPGSVDGLLKAHGKYGKLSLKDVLAPAIRLAEHGFILTRRQAERFNANFRSFSAFAGTRKYFTKGDPARKYVEGERFVQADLARVLKRIETHGRAGFYEGRTAQLIVTEMQRGHGLITHEDLLAYDSIEREPVVGLYRDYNIISMPPASSGGVALMQLLNAMEPYDINEMGVHASATIHLMGEAMRRVYADRTEWLGDSDYFDVPVEALIDKAYMRSRMASFDSDRITPSAAVAFGNPVGYESSETTHYSVVDESGHAVSVTTTINGGFGSHVVVDGAGFFLNNEMDDFSAKPGVPNMYGLIGSQANAIEPGKRMLSSMTPTIIEDPQGRLFMVIGTPGGATIITTVFQVILNVLDHGMDIQQAVAAPRIHHQWLPDIMQFEHGGLPKDVVVNLEKRGWTVVERKGTSGRADGITVSYGAETRDVGPSRGDQIGVGMSQRTLFGGADPRGEDAAAGF
jgi:gamma-glutamyltranspeptidase/glutathione hydrolase